MPASTPCSPVIPGSCSEQRPRRRNPGSTRIALRAQLPLHQHRELRLGGRAWLDAEPKGSQARSRPAILGATGRVGHDEATAHPEERRPAFGRHRRLSEAACAGRLEDGDERAQPASAGAMTTNRRGSSPSDRVTTPSIALIASCTTLRSAGLIGSSVDAWLVWITCSATLWANRSNATVRF